MKGEYGVFGAYCRWRLDFLLGEGGSCSKWDVKQGISDDQCTFGELR